MEKIVIIEECKDFVGETLRVGDYVRDFWYLLGIEGKITSMFKAGDYCYITVYNKAEDKTYAEVNPLLFVTKKWYEEVCPTISTEEFDKLRRQRDDFLDVKSFINLDKIRGNHEYIDATDTDGIQLAIGMRLRVAFTDNDDEYEYYVEKDPTTSEICLCGWNHGLPHIKKELEYADYLEVIKGYGKILFFDD